MDFRQTAQPSNNRPASAPVAPASTGTPKETGSKRGRGGKWFNVLNAVVLIGVAVIVALVALVIARGNGNGEYKFVDQKKYQAVFLNNGQVYFGNITDLNGKYVRLNNIFYLTQTQASSDSKDATASSSYSLVKLGCQQIHDPYDQMVINRDQVTFWENLQDNGKVVTSINQFKKQNPNGPDCSQVSSQTQASSTSAAQGGSTTTTPSTSTTTPSTTK